MKMAFGKQAKTKAKTKAARCSHASSIEGSNYA